MTKVCSIDGCGRPLKSLGWCQSHFMRWRRHGDPLAGRTPDGEPHRYFREVVLTYEGNDCLPWPYALTKGYGQIWIDGRMHLVSRIICEEVHGPPPTPEHHAAHSCGKGHEACVTKGHLDWKTPSGNQADRLVHGTHSRGERNGNAKLTESDVRQIIALKGIMATRGIAAQFGVGHTTISRIHHKAAWADQQECA